MYVISSISPLDKSVVEAIKERPDAPIRIRVQPMILRNKEGDGRASYHVWKDLHFLIEVENLDEAKAFREALSTFFWIASQQGIGAVRDKLAEYAPPSAQQIDTEAVNA